MTDTQGSTHIPESWPEDWPYSAVTEAEKLTEQRDELLEALRDVTVRLSRVEGYLSARPEIGVHLKGETKAALRDAQAAIEKVEKG